VLARLEQQARAVRARVEQLDQSLADAGAGHLPRRRGGHRATLTADLIAARDLARTRLSETVAALEIIRLDLLRLRAGTSGIGRITADLAAAGDIGAAVDRLLPRERKSRRTSKTARAHCPRDRRRGAAREETSLENPMAAGSR
jgi:hypothetical protein